MLGFVVELVSNVFDPKIMRPDRLAAQLDALTDPRHEFGFMVDFVSGLVYNAQEYHFNSLATYRAGLT